MEAVRVTRQPAQFSNIRCGEYLVIPASALPTIVDEQPEQRTRREIFRTGYAHKGLQNRPKHRGNRALLIGIDSPSIVVNKLMALVVTGNVVQKGGTTSRFQRDPAAG